METQGIISLWTLLSGKGVRVPPPRCRVRVLPQPLTLKGQGSIRFWLWCYRTWGTRPTPSSHAFKAERKENVQKSRQKEKKEKEKSRQWVAAATWSRKPRSMHCACSVSWNVTTDQALPHTEAQFQMRALTTFNYVKSNWFYWTGQWVFSLLKLVANIHSLWALIPKCERWHCVCCGLLK